ncbi:TolC family protein [Geobacter sulfurreducens]|uniref:TolC family protein n=1 Tax=Geobacter sulfurreducens TaxID=35554 RepID=UPI0001E342B5|nr:TolC family protein [Geobacter sulfurreducens]ADI83673.2 efflux pump, RND family, outer membrane protein [Geobacter sulfurreducens KN400]
MVRASRFVSGVVHLFLTAVILAPLGASGEVRTLTLPQAVEYALAHNGELKALRNEKDVARAGLERAVLLPNPTLELSADSGVMTGSPDETALSIGISQEFLTGGKRAKRRAVAEREAEAVHFQIADRERQLSLEVKSFFSELILAQKRRELAGRAVELNGKLLEITRERLAAGDIPELEVNLARVEVARSEGRKIEAEREFAPLLARLRTLLGVPTGEEIGFDGIPEQRPLSIPLDELIRLALENRPDLKVFQATSAQGEAAVELAEAERIPNVTLGLGFTHERSTDATGSGDEKTRDNLLGVTLSIPLPLFDRNQAGIREARAVRQGADNRLEFARSSVPREIEGDYARLAAAEKTLMLYADGILPQLEDNLKLVQEAYRLGEVGILAVIEEQKKYIEVNDDYLVALADRQAALARLEASVGTDFQNRTSGGAQ